MDCRTCRDRLSEHLDGMLAPPARDRVLAHVNGCEDCRRELGLLRATVAAVADLDPGAPAPELAERIIARLERDPAVTARGAETGRRWSGARFASTIAAALVLIVALTLWLDPFDPFDPQPAADPLAARLATELETLRNDLAARDRWRESQQVELDRRLEELSAALRVAREHAARSSAEGAAARAGVERLNAELAKLYAAHAASEDERRVLESRVREQGAEARRLHEALEDARREHAELVARTPASPPWTPRAANPPGEEHGAAPGTPARRATSTAILATTAGSIRGRG